MPGMSIYEMFEGERTVRLPVGKGIVNFRYNSARMSPALMVDLAKVEGDGSLRSKALGLEAMATVVAKIVTWWDVIDDDRQPVPLTQEAIAQLPLPFLTLMLDKMQEIEQGEAMPGETTSAPSDTISPRQAEPGTSQSGIRSSSPANGSTARAGNSYQNWGSRAGSNGRGRH